MPNVYQSSPEARTAMLKGILLENARLSSPELTGSGSSEKCKSYLEEMNISITRLESYVEATLRCSVKNGGSED